MACDMKQILCIHLGIDAEGKNIEYGKLIDILRESWPFFVNKNT